jgi:hypothetical protein
LQASQFIQKLAGYRPAIHTAGGKSLRCVQRFDDHATGCHGVVHHYREADTDCGRNQRHKELKCHAQT